jgi:hypothetical protein
MWHLLARGFLPRFQIPSWNLVAYYNDHMNELANNVLIGICYVHKSHALWAHMHFNYYWSIMHKWKKLCLESKDVDHELVGTCWHVWMLTNMQLDDNEKVKFKMEPCHL